MDRIITRIKGGLGNQLFCYAAARRLALVNNAELVIDDRSGFTWDHLYQRQYNLHHFNIPCRTASANERLEPFARVRRGMLKWMSNRRSFNERCYLQQEGLDFDERLLALKVKGTLYLDGYWQSENYFKDVEQIIRTDLKIVPPADAENNKMAQMIRECNAVALHLRWFDKPGNKPIHNLPIEYYRQAIPIMEKKLKNPHYFIFSDNPSAAQFLFSLPEGKFTLVSHNRTADMAYADLWLISECKHFITANSTFSWWGAWLSNYNSKIIIAPNSKGGEILTDWDFKGLIPNTWIKI